MNAPDLSRATRILPYAAAAIAEGAALIAAGHVVAVPTETVYGLAADAGNPRAVAAIYAAKGRPAFNPLIVHVADVAAARALAVFDARAELLAAAFWPGPLTLVLPRRRGSGIAALATAGLDTIAIRVPAHRAMRRLLEASQVPLAAPSANASGTISPTRAAHVLASLGGRIPLIIDDGACVRGIESTIVWSADGRTQILRHGPVTAHAVRRALQGDDGDDGDDGDGGGGVGIADFDTGRGPDDRAIVAPGQLAQHYAPTKPLRIQAERAAADEYLIGFGAIAGDVSLSPSGDLAEAAARLFDLLHSADASDRAAIAVAPVPEAGLGAAINDRLRRAAYRDTA